MFNVVARDRSVFKSVRSAVLSAPWRHAVEDLDHVQSAERTVGVQALDQRPQGGVLPYFRGPVTVTAAVPVTEPLLAVTVLLVPLPGAVNTPALVIVPAVALQVNVGTVVIAWWN